MTGFGKSDFIRDPLCSRKSIVVTLFEKNAKMAAY
jgi:hypothetical protein